MAKWLVALVQLDRGHREPGPPIGCIFFERGCADASGAEDEADAAPLAVQIIAASIFRRTMAASLPLGRLGKVLGLSATKGVARVYGDQQLAGNGEVAESSVYVAGGPASCSSMISLIASTAVFRRTPAGAADALLASSPMIRWSGCPCVRQGSDIEDLSGAYRTEKRRLARSLLTVWVPGKR